TPPSPRSTLFPYTTLFRSLEGVRQAYPGARLWAVFEPRSATSRRAVFQHEYTQAFRAADRVLIADVYHHREQLAAEERFSPQTRSEEHTSELQSLTNLVCR